MHEQSIARHVGALIEAAEDHTGSSSGDREDARNLYDGTMTDLAPREGGSKVVSRDLRTLVRKVRPSIHRTFFGSDRFATMLPKEPGQEQMAEEATDYLNDVVVDECNLEEAIDSACWDALVLKTGIVKWGAYTHRRVRRMTLPDVSSLELEGLPEEVEIESAEMAPETDPMALALDPTAERGRVVLRQMVEEVEIRVDAVPRDNFLILSGAVEIEDSAYVGERLTYTRSELVQRGYDRATVDALATAGGSDAGKASREGEDYREADIAAVRKAMEPVEVFEGFVQLDLDDDGITEWHEVVLARGEDQKDDAGWVLLEREEVEEPRFAKIVAEREPHQFEGRSLTEDTNDTQRANTELLRATVDNAYAANNPQLAINGAMGVEAVERILKRGFLEPIITPDGAKVDEMVSLTAIPFFAQHSYGVMESLKREAEERTGVMDMAGGLGPESLQNTSATAAMLAAQPALASADMMVKTMAKGIRRVVKGVFKLVVEHHGQRSIRKGEGWREFDPSGWDADMDAEINVGLGGGSKERDAAAMQMVLQLQERIAGLTGGPQSPFVEPGQIYNALERLCEALGLPSASPFFTRPDPQKVAALMEQQAQQPSPEQMKVEAQKEIEAAKAQAAQVKEQAQMQADLMVKQADIAARQQSDEMKLAMQREQMAQKYDLERAKIEANIIMNREKAQVAANAPVPDIVEGGL